MTEQGTIESDRLTLFTMSTLNVSAEKKAGAFSA